MKPLLREKEFNEYIIELIKFEIEYLLNAIATGERFENPQRDMRWLGDKQHRLKIAKYALKRAEAKNFKYDTLEDGTYDGWLPEDTVLQAERLGIPAKLSDNVCLQSFHLDYVPDQLPMLTVKYFIMNNK